MGSWPHTTSLSDSVAPAALPTAVEGALGPFRPLQPQETNIRPHPLITPVSPLAIVSFVFGLLAVCFTPPLASAGIAIITGLIARRQIRRAGGQLDGRRYALAGLVMGIISLGLSLLALAFYAVLWIINLTANGN